jgi:hypothetical protein
MTYIKYTDILVGSSTSCPALTFLSGIGRCLRESVRETSLEEHLHAKKHYFKRPRNRTDSLVGGTEENFQNWRLGERSDNAEGE